MHSRIRGSGSDGRLDKDIPVAAGFRYTSDRAKEWGVKSRWAVSQRGNVNDRDLGISAFGSDSYLP
jgi:hypothetical protein